MSASAPTEGLFSEAGQVLTEKRKLWNRLDPDLLADLVFCGENLDFVRDGHRVENVAAAAAACSSSSSTAAAVAQQPGRQWQQ